MPSAARSLVAPEPALIRAAAVTRVPAPVFHRARPQVSIRNGSAPIVVQLGAFSNEANAERAWLQASSRYGLGGRAPLTTTIDVNGRRFHRVSVSGFASAGDAQRLCGQIRDPGRRLLRPRPGRRRLDPLGRALRQSAPRNV